MARPLLTQSRLAASRLLLFIRVFVGVLLLMMPFRPSLGLVAGVPSIFSMTALRLRMPCALLASASVAFIGVLLRAFRPMLRCRLLPVLGGPADERAFRPLGCQALARFRPLVGRAGVDRSAGRGFAAGMTCLSFLYADPRASSAAGSAVARRGSPLCGGVARSRLTSARRGARSAIRRGNGLFVAGSSPSGSVALWQLIRPPHVKKQALGLDPLLLSPFSKVSISRGVSEQQG